MPVYLDLVLILNFAVDFMLLLAADHISGHRAGVKRCAIAAAVGSFYAGVCLLRPFAFLGGVVWRIVVLISMGVCAFGCNRTAIRRMVLFVFLSLALGGGVSLSGRGGFFAVLLGAGVVLLLCFYGFGSKSSKKFVPVSITYKDKHERFFALLDTGNILKDPVSGSAVLVVAPAVAMRLLGLTEAQLRDPVLSVVHSGIAGLRLIPYRSVGCSSGMLLAMDFPDVQIGREKGRAVVAFSPTGFGSAAEFQALTGGI